MERPPKASRPLKAPKIQAQNRTIAPSSSGRLVSPKGVFHRLAAAPAAVECRRPKTLFPHLESTSAAFSIQYNLHARGPDRFCYDGSAGCSNERRSRPLGRLIVKLSEHPSTHTRYHRQSPVSLQAGSRQPRSPCGNSPSRFLGTGPNRRGARRGGGSRATQSI
jgi:hypothetical protein